MSVQNRSSRKGVGGLAAAALASAGLSMAHAADAAAASGTAHAFSFVSITGEPLPLDTFAGKAVLIVNTASKCGFTPQYDGLQALWDQYRDQGLVVLGVPSNDFGGQEPGTEEQIQQFCSVNFNIDFPMTSKVSVIGSDAHPFYKWAREEVGFVGAPKWNFHKYLIGPDGMLVDWFSSMTGPKTRRLTAAIEAALPAQTADDQTSAAQDP